jgi:transposase-like protein
MNEKQIRTRYTLEFKQEAVRQVKGGRAAVVVTRTLGMPKTSLSNWVRADAKGQLAKTTRGCLDGIALRGAAAVIPPGSVAQTHEQTP